MDKEPQAPPLRPLHASGTLVPSKLDVFRKLTTAALLRSLEPGHPGALKAKADGTMMDGHHRVAVLRERSVDVDVLPREAIPERSSEDSLDVD